MSGAPTGIASSPGRIVDSGSCPLARSPSITMTRLCHKYTAESKKNPVDTALRRPKDARIFPSVERAARPEFGHQAFLQEGQRLLAQHRDP
jgi:hypothetical protein